MSAVSLRRDLTGYGGGGKGGGESQSINEASDSLHSLTSVRLIDLIGCKEIEGLVDGARSIALNETPVQNADGTYNFSNLTIDFRPGTQDQDYIPGFPSVESEQSVGVELTSATPWSRGFSNTDLSAVRIRFSIPALSQTDTSNNAIKGYRIEYRVEVSTDGGSFETMLYEAFDGKTTSTYERSRRINLKRASMGWVVRVVRVTPNANTSLISDRVNIVSITEVIDSKLRYPNSALIGLQADARQFTSIPSRAYFIKGRRIRVPDNYDPVSRTYSGVWQGQFKVAWTNNPAWIFYDLALDDMYGLGHLISQDQVDKWSIYQIGRYCDEWVSDGQGRLEPRFICGVFFQSRADAYKVLQDMASIFRGMAFYAGDAIYASADMPVDPAYAYTAANVIDGKFTRAGSSRKSRYTVANVSWSDQGDYGRAKVEYVSDEEGIRRYGVQSTDVTAFGCISQSQAHRVGRWILLTSKLETESITFQVGLDGAVARPGSIVRIADPRRMGRRNGGRIRAGTGNSVTLDKAPVVQVGDALTVILPSAESETRPVVAVDGDTVTVNPPWSMEPQAESVWSVDNIDLVAPFYRIINVAEKGDLTFEISAVQHEPGKYAYIESGIAIEPRPTTVIPMRYQAPVSKVTLSTYTVSERGDNVTTMVITWPAADRAVSYQVDWRRDSGEWVSLPRTESLSVEVAGIYSGAYQVRVKAFNSIDVGSAVVLSAVTQLEGNLGAPPDVPWFSINGDVLSWGAVHDAELAGYRVRYHYGSNRSWGDAADLVSGMVQSSPYQILSRPQGALTLMIKAENKAGLQSNAPTYIMTEMGDALVANVVEEFDFHGDGYPGQISGAIVVDGDLRAEGTLAFWGNDLADYWPLDDGRQFFTDNYKRMVYETTIFTPSVVAAGLTMTLDVDFQGGVRTIEYRSGGGDPYFGSDANPFFGADDTEFFTPLPGYQPWPGSLSAQLIQYQLRFTVDTGPDQGVISACKAVIDVPDIYESFDDIVVPPAGIRLPIAKKYLAIKNVQLTLQADGGTALSARYIDKSVTQGPLVKCFNSAGVAVAGSLDARIQGY
ncbi:host specificity protein J [Herbaspirillum sp. CAH-3]|uniref:host specificity protein J n=1 Tax=Herbaspirillum sp. CAH-3 TaxID=2605746 RepID=UPI0012AC9705|nr:phage tail protein [Herbaspirillum sp. CAH-3]MRT27648.1 host specificity protein J [Herbaspirillum sp. CAH-3]